jgi:hypothetical protein
MVEDDSMAEEFDQVAKNLDLVLVHLFLRWQSLFAQMWCWFDGQFTSITIWSISGSDYK